MQLGLSPASNFLRHTSSDNVGGSIARDPAQPLPPLHALLPTIPPAAPDLPTHTSTCLVSVAHTALPPQQPTPIPAASALLYSTPLPPTPHALACPRGIATLVCCPRLPLPVPRKAPPAPLSFLRAARMPLPMATPACSDHRLCHTLPEASEHRDAGGTAAHRRAAAGRLMHTFELYERNMEVVHAHVFHSGIVSVAYPTPDAPPKLTLSTWSGSIHSGSVSLLQHTLPLTAEPGELLECIAVHPGPPVHSDVGQYTAALQVRPRRASAPAPLPYSCSTSTPGPPHHRCTQSWGFSPVIGFPESARHGGLAKSAAQRSAMHRRWPLRASTFPPVQP